MERHLRVDSYTTRKQMNTQEIIDDMEEFWKKRDKARAEIERLKEALSKAIVEIGRLQNLAPAMPAAADRLEKLERDRDEARAEVSRMQDACAAELEQMRKALGVRPEPSRLEIAAMIYAGIEHIDDDDALKAADKLIAAARRTK